MWEKKEIRTIPIVFLFVGLGFELRALSLQTLSHTSSPFCSGYFGNGISRTIC
jgi:hypothetical protein